VAFGSTRVSRHPEDDVVARLRDHAPESGFELSNRSDLEILE
jgi:hypothetical protein